MKSQIRNLEELTDLVSQLVPQLSSKQLLLLDGPMGAGKTTFVNLLVKAMGGPSATSPTFALHHRYETSKGPVDHLDLFRLKSAQELEDIGLWDMLAQKSGVVIVEWADRLDATVWPTDWKILCVHISVLDSIRTIEMREGL